MPAVPAFAGDLHADDSLGTRAIMEYQYNSICRGGNSIMETATKAGVPNVKDYIGFYNLRNYDRLNTGGEMKQVEKESGVSYEGARKEHDDVVGAGYDGQGEGTGASWGKENPEYESYQKAGARVGESQGDSVSACYMEGGPDIQSFPWNGGPEEEMDAFVSEGMFDIRLLFLISSSVFFPLHLHYLSFRYLTITQSSTSTPRSSSPTTASP